MVKLFLTFTTRLVEALPVWPTITNNATNTAAYSFDVSLALGVAMCTFTGRCKGQRRFDVELWRKYLKILRELNSHGSRGWEKIIASSAEGVKVVQRFFI